MAIGRIGPGEAAMTDPAERAGTETDIAPAGMARRWIELNIHDRAAIRIAEDAPTASLLRDMFAPFRAQGLERHDLTITAELEPMPGASHNEHEYRHTDSSLYLAAIKVQLVVDGDGFRLHGTRELLTSTLPLLDRILVGRDVAMIHAATFDYRGHGVAMPAWGGVGKTSTIAKLLRVDGVAFMGDDWAFMAGDGRLLGYAKPMFIKPHHRPIYPHLFSRRRKPLVPSALSSIGYEGSMLDVSVVVPVRNAERLLDACLASIARSRPRELIVVDGRSTDSTGEIAWRYTQRLLSDEGRGLPVARLLG